MRFAKVCAPSYAEVWKISNEALAYPNAELVRKALVTVLPPGSIVLLPHYHFGVDLGAGTLGQVEGGVCLRRGGHRRDRRQHSQSGPPGIRRTGERSRSLRYLLRRGDQYTSRRIQAGRRRCCERHRGRQIAEVGALTARRRYLETVVAEAGDVDITGRTFWFPSAAASRNRRTWRLRRSWPMPWAER